MAGRIVGFVEGVIVGVVALWIFTYVLFPSLSHVTCDATSATQPRIAPQTVYIQPQTSVLSKSLGDQLAEGGAYAPR
ncbi:MAG TPA: hypothetical protein VFB50_06415 [Chloroflexota bacterium]|nr:hypothetical protein [Chloroflexota bacterium]